MSCFSAKYRMVSADNVAGCWQAWFNNSLSEEDLQLMMSSENKLKLAMNVTEKGMTVDMSVSLKPEYNISFEHEFGVEKDFGAPFNCKSTITRVGDTGIKEVSAYTDGTTYNIMNDFSSRGYTSKICGPDGYIGTVYFEQEDSDMTGFWVLESHENGDKMIAEDANISAAAAAELCTNLAMRVTENNGIYTMTDWMGNGSSKTMAFKIGEEFEIKDADLGMNGTEIVTQNGPGCYTMVYNDSTGKTSAWEAKVTEDYCVWKVTKPLNTTCATFTYRRMADFFGDWKLVAVNNVEAAMLLFGLPESMVKTMAAERPTHSIKYMGKGMVQWSSDSKAMAIPPITWKSGEEFSYKIGDWVMHEVMVHTKDGMAGSTNSAGFKSIFKAKVGKKFMVMESETDGYPLTKATHILARV